MKLWFPLLALFAVGCSSSAESATNSEAALEGAQADSTYPAVGLLQSASGELATGTLVAPNVVLTIADAFALDDKVAVFYTGAGVPTALGSDPAAALSSMKKHAVAEAVSHPSVTTATDSDHMFDVQVVRLAESITDIAPVKVATEAAAPGSGCTLVSYGAYTEGQNLVAYARRAGEMKMGTSTDFLFEALEGPAWPSAGDAASPFLCDGAVAGLYVFDEGVVGSSAPAKHFFNRTDSINAWITSQIQAWGH